MTEKFGQNKLKIVGKIDLSQFEKKKTDSFEKRKNNYEILDNSLKAMAEKVNAEYGYFLKPDGSIDMMADDYLFSNKGVDMEYIVDKEKIFASKDGLGREQWAEKREQSPGIVTEKLLTLVLHKFLGDNFIVARTATFDDYYHGVDNLIIDKETGTPICGFDEMGADEETSYRQKGEKIYNSIIKRNGVYVKYGATIRHESEEPNPAGELYKKSLKNVPAFYLSMGKEDLNALLPLVGQDGKSAAELAVFERLLRSIETQLGSLYKDYINLDRDLAARRHELLLEQEELKDRLGDPDWSQTNEGRNWKWRMGKNNLRLNIKNFQKSLDKMKAILEKNKTA